MTRFDAPAHSPSALGSAFRAAGALVAARYGIVLAALIVTILAQVVVTSLLGAGTGVPVALRQAFVASPVLVFVRPTASRSDVEAIGPKLSALPDVAAATLRPKEEALAALVAAGVPAPTDGRNPLPDVWTVVLHGDGSSFITEAVTVRDALSALPLVDSVRFDEAWARSLDRTATMWSRFGAAWLAVVVAATGLALACTYMLFGRALATPEAPVPVSALVIVALCFVILSVSATYAICALIGDQFTAIDWPGSKPIALAVRLSIGKTIVEEAACCLILLAGGIAMGYPRNSPGQSH